MIESEELENEDEGLEDKDSRGRYPHPEDMNDCLGEPDPEDSD